VITSRALASIPTVSYRRVLSRIVPLLDLIKHLPPRFLYASGQPGRFNPEGIECVYFAEDESIAAAEFRARWRGTTQENQPRTSYFAGVNLSRVLDLCDMVTVKQLGLDRAELLMPWRGVSTETATQALGRAVAERRSQIAAIRYPSVAAGGIPGVNVVIFPTNVKPPDFVKIFGRNNEPLAEWP
jgi:RES domain-containing protein